MLELSNLSVKAGPHLILNQLNLSVAEGEFVMIVGANGAGKSTLFNLISGYTYPTSGAIQLNKKNVTDLPQYKRARWVAKMVQDPKLGTVGDMTIEENMALAYTRGQPRGLKLFRQPNRRALYQEKLATLNMGLENHLDTLVGNLSGGQRQALALIMTTLGPSAVLLLDEITAALDPKTSERVMILTDRLVKQTNQTTLMITHSMEHALTYGDKTIVLSDGQITDVYTRTERLKLSTSDLIKHSF